MKIVSRSSVLLVLLIGSFATADWTMTNYDHKFLGTVDGFVDQYPATCTVTAETIRARSMFDYRVKLVCGEDIYVLKSEISYQIRQNTLINPLNYLIVGHIVDSSHLSIEEVYVTMSREVELKWTAPDTVEMVLARRGGGPSLSFRGPLELQ